MTQRQLTRLLHKWHPRLPVRDWTFTVTLKEQDNDGECEWDETRMEAWVWIRPGLEPKDAEKTLIHEMLHPLEIENEKAVNLVADALWRAYQPRRKQK